MFAHSFDRFYMVTKFILPTIGDLKFSKLNYDDTCAYMDNKNAQNTETRKYMLDLKTFWKEIEPFVVYYSEMNSYILRGLTHYYYFVCIHIFTGLTRYDY